MLAPRTLTARLVTTMVVLVAFVSALVIGISAVVMDQYLTNQKDQELVSALQRGLHPRVDGGRPPDGFDGDGDGDGRERSPYFFGQAPGTIVMVEHSGGSREARLLTSSAVERRVSDRTMKTLAEVPADGEGHDVDLGVGDYRAASGTDAAGSRVVIGLPNGSIRATVLSLLFWSILAGLALVAAAFVAGRVLIRRQLRPLRQVAATAHEVTEQPLSTGSPELSLRVDDGLTDPSTEVGAVGHALNTLLDHMSEALESRHRSELQVRQFVADASHELRTPLATIHGYAELSRRTPDDPVALSTALAKVETETDRMKSLVEDLLLLARLDAGRPLEREEVDVTRLLLESVADARVVDAQNGAGHRWQLSLPEEPVSVTGDEQRLHQLVTNLLGNARNHTPPGTTVTVSASRPDHAVVVEVHDDGPGLPTDLADHVFERFTRGDSSRTRASGGAGLGLSLVSAIAQAHGGTAAVDSGPGDTTFRITLPAVD
jgi:two-component system OmpR family sensor kinase